MWTKQCSCSVGSGQGMLGWVAGLVVTIVLAGLCGGYAVGEQPGSAATAPAKPGGAVQEIHVDASCGVRQDRSGTPAPAGFTPNPSICRLVGGKTSEHVESGVRKDLSLLKRVTVTEQEYLLRNPSAAPVAFVLEYPLAQGWEIDTDSPPTKMVGATAIFRVIAGPGESVRVHVGERHVVPLTGTLKDDDDLGK
jgi:hypothetical protein